MRRSSKKAFAVSAISGAKPANDSSTIAFASAHGTSSSSPVTAAMRS